LNWRGSAIAGDMQQARTRSSATAGGPRIAVAAGRFYFFVRSQLLSVMNPPSIG